MPKSLGCEKIEDETERQICKQQESDLNKLAAETAAKRAKDTRDATEKKGELKKSHAEITGIAAGTVKSSLVTAARKKASDGESGIVKSWGLGGGEGGSKKRNRKIQSKKKSRRTRRAKR